MQSKEDTPVSGIFVVQRPCGHLFGTLVLFLKFVTMTRKAQNSHKHATVAGSLTLCFVLDINQSYIMIFRSKMRIDRY